MRYSLPSDKKINDEEYIHPNPETFDSPIRQCFSLPSTIINYIIHNPLSAEGLQKVQKTCKYFFAKKKVIVVNEHAHFYEDSSIKAIISTRYYHYSLPSGKAVYWLNNELYNRNSKSLLPNVYRCSLKALTIHHEDLTLNEMNFLLNGGKIRIFWTCMVNIFDDDGIAVSCDKILSKMPYIQEFQYEHPNEIFSSETYQQMADLQLQKKFKKLRLTQHGVTENIDFSHLCKFIKNNATSGLILYFDFYIDRQEIDRFVSMLKDTTLEWMKKNKVLVQVHDNHNDPIFIS